MKDPLSGVLKEILKVPETVWKDVESSTKNMVDWLVNKGNLSAEDAKAIIADLGERSRGMQRDFEQRIDHFLSQSLKPFALPKREKMTQLRQKVNSMIDKVDSLEAAWNRKQNGSED